MVLRPTFNIFHYKNIEFDIGGAKAFLLNANMTNISDDEAKLAREGKGLADSLINTTSRKLICRVSFKFLDSVAIYVGHDLYICWRTQK